MITSSAAAKTLMAIGGSIGAFLWVPDAAEWTRNYVSKPLIKRLDSVEAKQINLMASMKHFDIRTDELAEELSDINDLIKEAQKELAGASEAHKQAILERLRRYKQMREKAIKKQDRATGKDLELLANLSNRSV